MAELPVKLGRLWIRTTDHDPELNFRALLHDTPPRVVDGYAGWQLISRYRRRSLIEWGGSNPPLVEIRFMLDRWGDVGDGESGEGMETEEKIRTLERMAGLDKHQPEPPKLHWNANAPHDHAEAPHLEWVIESLEWDSEGTYRHPVSGHRVRQSGTLLIRQFEDDTFIRSGSNLVGGGNNRENRRGSTYVVQRGDTLSEIAKKKLGNARRWREIAKLNNIRDPRKLRVGQKLKLPPKKK